MNPHEALNLLYQAAGAARLTRKQHMDVEQAAQVLAGILREIDEKSKKAKEPPVKQEVPEKKDE